jgi:secondary thiamine-phosphate synthase enzyme
MQFHTKTLNFETSQPIILLDITHEVRMFAEGFGLTHGMLTVASGHTTLGVVLNERCDELQKDMVDFLGRLAPLNGDYRHNRVAQDGRPNTHSHLLSLLIPSAQTILLTNGHLVLGKWQSVFLVELDGPRPLRKVQLTLMGV